MAISHSHLRKNTKLC